MIYIIIIGLTIENLSYTHIITRTGISSRQLILHLFFINSDSLDEEQLKDLVKFTIEQIEPHFVRNDNKLPCKNHMYSYISFIIITRNKPDDNVKLMIEKTNIVKKYMFGARGYSNIRLVCVTPSQFSVISNRYGKEISDYLKKMMSSGY